MTTISLAFDGVTLERGNAPVLQDATFHVPKGSLVWLVGENGTGKSTLLDATVGRISPAHGTVTVLGHSPEQARKKGLIAEVRQHDMQDRVFPLSVKQIVESGLCGAYGLLKTPPKTARDHAMHCLERVGLSELSERTIGQLSGGQRRRVILARAMAQRAQLLLLDEPFAGVDSSSFKVLASCLAELSDEGCTIVCSTHTPLHLSERSRVLRLTKPGQPSLAEQLGATE